MNAQIGWCPHGAGPCLRPDGIGAYTLSEWSSLTLDGLDEALSEGTMAKKSFYDYIIAGDEVFLLPQNQGKTGDAIQQPAVADDRPPPAASERCAAGK